MLSPTNEATSCAFPAKLAGRTGKGWVLILVVYRVKAGICSCGDFRERTKEMAMLKAAPSEVRESK
jgi:hypothetical protein